MSLYHEQKKTLRDILNRCIESGKTAEETKTLLRLAKNNCCNQCYLNALASGFRQAFCDHNDMCFLEEAVKTYSAVAEKKCVPQKPPAEEVEENPDTNTET